MRYLVLCCDYDGTLARHGRVRDETFDALDRLIASGRRVVLVTGRELDDLRRTCPRLEAFEYVVAENGALLYHPASRTVLPLAGPPPDAFVRALRERGVDPLSVGRSIVATCEPWEATVLDVIRALGLEMQVIFNKGAVMVLPAGVNKATGLQQALARMGLSPRNAAGIGDAENDHAFLSLCECSAAVANALPSLRDEVDLVTAGEDGSGVEELIEALLRDDLASLEPRLGRHHILLGTDADGKEVRIAPYGENVLLVGISGSGKSTLATGMLERLAGHGYTFCVIDPEGDYDTFSGAVCLGTPARPPSAEEAVQLLGKPDASAVLNLVGVPIADRPTFFIGLLSRLQELRSRTGRPHWIVMDEAHHLLPSQWQPVELTLPEKLQSVLQITVHPGLMARHALEDVDVLLTVGAQPSGMIEEFARVCSRPMPEIAPVTLEPGEALLWRTRGTRGTDPPVRLRVAPSRTERRRHTRKYAEGELGPDRSFYFKGPQGKLNLRAHNLVTFMQLADGVDDETWLHHLHSGDYSRWVRDCIKDEGVAAKIRAVENDAGMSAADSRRLIRAAIEEQYTLPASE